MKIENIVFDFGGVLVDWNPRYLYQDLFDTDEQMEYFLTHICTESWNIEQDAGRSLEEATKTLQKQFPEYTSLIQRYYDDWEVMLNDQIAENTALLPKLKDKNYRLFGLTNWSGETFPIALKRFSFFKIFEGIVVSGDEKMIKPSDEIYFLLLNRYQLDPKTSIFIDDNSKNIAAAKKIGFHTIHFCEGTNLEEELKRIKIL
ncbi:MAG: HAD family phosphatase [Cyclobacteriaceae bacterium]|nr:HAD family phosphatase [Cyclobacteriaceae bacterium]